MMHLLPRLNSVVDSVDLGKKALSAVASHDYDLVFMDIGLPDLDGVEVSRLIRSMDDANKSQVPIIALTGHSDVQLARRCHQVNINRVLLKPITKEAIFELCGCQFLEGGVLHRAVVDSPW